MKRKKQIYSQFLEASRATGVPVKKVMDIFFLLSAGDPVDNKGLLQKVGVSRNALNHVKVALSYLLKPTSKDTQLTPDGVDQVRKLYQNEYVSEEELWSFLENKQFQEMVSLLQNIKEKRPKPKRRYDQFPATIETTARRASLLNFFADIKDKRILFLGDNDFTSVTTASLKKAKKIVVIDIDEQILKEIGNISNNHSLGIAILKYDARKKLHRKLANKFDVVFTDPPYTPSGVKLFVSRSIETLDPNNKATRVYVCYGNSDRAKERFLPIYKVFAESGLMIRWIFDKFNRYHGAESIGSSSSLFVTESTPKTKSLIRGNYDKSIYTFD